MAWYNYSTQFYVALSKYFYKRILAALAHFIIKLVARLFIHSVGRKQSWKNKNFEVQDYLFPFVVDLSEDKIEALLFLQTQILDLGIEIERLGPMSLGIKSAPSLIKDAALPQLFEKMANDLIEYGDSYAIEKKIADLFASMACHSVVRAGQSLSHSQMHELLTSMDQFSLSSFCPHGRPVSVETTFLELDKLFGRIN